MICWGLAACREFWSELCSLEGHSVTGSSVKQVQTWDIGSWCICKWQHTLNPYPRHLGCDNMHLLGGCTLHEWLHSDISSHANRLTDTQSSDNSLVTIGPALNKHFVIIYVPLHIQLHLCIQPPWSLLWECLGTDWHWNAWRFLNTSPVPLSCCITLGSLPVLTKASPLHSITFNLSLWPIRCRTGQIISAAWNTGMCRPPAHHTVSGIVRKLMLIVNSSTLIVPLVLSMILFKSRLLPKFLC